VTVVGYNRIAWILLITTKPTFDLLRRNATTHLDGAETQSNASHPTTVGGGNDTVVPLAQAGSNRVRVTIPARTHINCLTCTVYQ